MGFSKAMSAGWILLDKSAGAPTITRKVQSITDTIKVLFKRSKVREDKWRDMVLEEGRASSKSPH